MWLEWVDERTTWASSIPEIWEPVLEEFESLETLMDGALSDLDWIFDPEELLTEDLSL